MLCRLDIAAGDWHAVKASLKSAAELCENGGDWERKNRLKVYDATFRLATRDLAGAAGLFLDSIATFTSCAPPIRTPNSTRPADNSVDKWTSALCTAPCLGL